MLLTAKLPRRLSACLIVIVAMGRHSWARPSAARPWGPQLLGQQLALLLLRLAAALNPSAEPPARHPTVSVKTLTAGQRHEACAAHRGGTLDCMCKQRNDCNMRVDTIAAYLDVMESESVHVIRVRAAPAIGLLLTQCTPDSVMSSPNHGVMFCTGICHARSDCHGGVQQCRHSAV